MGWAERSEPREGCCSSPAATNRGWVKRAGSCLLRRLGRRGLREASFNPPPQHLLRPAWRPLPACGGARTGTQEGVGLLTWRKRAARARRQHLAAPPRVDPGGRARPLAAAALCFRGCVAVQLPPLPLALRGRLRPDRVGVQHLPAPPPGRPRLQPPLSPPTHLSPTYHPHT